MAEINIKEILNNINNNLDDENYINININLIINNLDKINYNLCITELICMLDNTNFIIMFLDKFLDKILVKNMILKDIIKNTKDITKIKNLFILEIDYTFLLEIFILNSLNENEYIVLLEWIYEIGKINLINALIDNLLININLIKYDIIFNMIINFIKLHEKLIDTEFYSNFTKKLIPLLLLLITLFELTEYLKNIYSYQSENIHNNKINLIFQFYKTVIKNREIYFEVEIINDVMILINLLIKNDENNDSYINIIDDLCNLLYSDKLNIHDKTILITNILKLITNDKVNYIPHNFIEYINYYVGNIKFISWSTIDEKILMLELISRSLLEIKERDELYIDKFDSIIYNILYLEQETFDIIKSVLKSEVIYTNYNLVKNSIYNLITIINIFNDILIIYFDMCKSYDIYYADLLHKNNLILNIYINFFSNEHEIKNKFNTNILIQPIIINKLLIINKHCDYNEFPINSLEYDMVINYYKSLRIKYIYDLDLKIDELKQKCIKSNEFIEKGNDTYVDNIFSIEIIQPIMIPKSEYFYEKATMYLLVRETSQHPYTREKLLLNDIIEYNKQEIIKEKLDNYLKNKLK